jgi:tRNA A-37 threonylcarbamoyl transferase component Bud32
MSEQSKGSTVQLGPRTRSEADVTGGTGADVTSGSDKIQIAPVFAPPADLEPGMVVGEFRIERKVAQGGMASVYSAVHPLIGKQAAIKVIHPAFCTDASMVARFLQEARSVNQIRHMNIVDVFSFGTLPDGRVYSVMEWLEGETLRERLDKRKLELAEISDILDQIADALEASHRADVIHRDLKPENVFLVPARRGLDLAKLLDFGIAKLIPKGDDTTPTTRADLVLGTPQYMSPEQARGKRVDHQSDVYSLGVMAFEMVLGRLPFLADNAMDMVRQHLTEPPPQPEYLWKEIPRGMSVMLMRMLDKHPQKRPSLKDVRAQLANPGRVMLVGTGLYMRSALVGGDSFERTEPSLTPAELAAAGRGRRRLGLAVAGTIALGIVGVAITLFARTPTPVQLMVPEMSPGRVVNGPIVDPPLPSPTVTLPAVTEGSLSFTSNVPVRFEVDGKQIASSTKRAELPVLSEGEHEVSASAAGYKPWHRKVHISAGVRSDLDVRLEHVPSAKHRPRPVDTDYLIDPSGKER